MKKQLSLKNLKKKADKIFSEYIRRRDNGLCVCCGKVATWQEMQCGHYYSRGKFGTRYNEINCNSCCCRCNVFLSGNYPAYSEFMYNKYTKKQMTKLKEESKKVGIDIRELCNKVIKKYTKKLKEMP